MAKTAEEVRLEVQNAMGLKPEEIEERTAEALDGMTGEELEQKAEESVSSFAPGSIVKGRIVATSGDDAVVDIGYKSEGYVPLAEFSDTSETTPGAEIEVFLEVVEDESGMVVLSKRRADRIRGWERVIEKHKIGDVVSGRVIRKIKGGLLVDIGVPVFLPASQVDIRRVGDVAEYVGREIQCKIIKIDEGRRNIVLSRRKLLEEDRDRKKEDLFRNIQRGEVRRGIVKNITDFGAFVDLGGVDGLLHITDVSWGRVNHPSDVLSTGQIVDVMVLDFNVERERISLGLKQLQPNPWDGVPDKYPIGSRVKGTVVNIMPYGAFVKLEPGVEGLVHVSEMSWTRQVQQPSDIVSVSQEVEVVVLDINTDKQEISLGMKQTEADPWSKVGEKYPSGTRIKGKVRNLTNYGAFVALEEGVDGLLHVSDMSWTKKVAHPSALLKKGDEVECIVLAVDQERKRVSLGLKQLEEDPWTGDIPAKYHVGDMVKGKVTKLTSFGAFVEIAQDLEGLLHISEISTKKVDRPEDMLQPGQDVEAMIINVDPTNRKLGLSIKALDRGAQETVRKKEEKRKDGPAEASVADMAAYRDRGSLRFSVGEALKASEEAEAPRSDPEEPKAEEPKAEEPKVEEPKVEEPKPAEPEEAKPES